MKNKLYFTFFAFFMVVNLWCASGTQGVKKMGNESWPIRPIEIAFKDGILSMFPIPLANTFGMVAGKPDHESLRKVFIHPQHFHETIFPQNAYEPSDEIGICLDNRCDEMFMSAKRILSVVDWKNNKQTIEYFGVGKVLKNRYIKTKVIDRERKTIMTVFTPFYNSNYNDYNNGTFSLTIEDIPNKKRIKAIPISTESGDFRLIDKSFFGSVPLVSFGPSCVIYRESHEYRWLAVNNDLDYIEHPLKDTLNEYKEYFGTDLVSMEISPDQPYAVAVGQREIGLRHYVAIIQWNKAPAVMPVPLTLQKNEDIEYSSLLLSPSGKWAYFNTSGGPIGSRHFLLYIDPSLPGGCLPPFDLQVPGYDNKATWITKPEGFVMQVGEKMQYWDLSAFDPCTAVEN